MAVMHVPKNARNVHAAKTYYVVRDVSHGYINCFDAPCMMYYLRILSLAHTYIYVCVLFAHYNAEMMTALKIELAYIILTVKNTIRVLACTMHMENIILG